MYVYVCVRASERSVCEREKRASVCVYAVYDTDESGGESHLRCTTTLLQAALQLYKESQHHAAIT